MNPIITITNQKGGVAKTTTAISIAHGLTHPLTHSQADQVPHSVVLNSVVLVDLDQQGQCAIGLGQPPRSGVFDYLVGDMLLYNCLIATGRINLDLMPGNSRTKHADLIFRNEAGGFDALCAKLRTIASLGVLVLDTPTAGLLQEAALRIADVVVIPARCETLSVDSVHATLSLASRLNSNARQIILPTMFDKRLREHEYNLGVLRSLTDSATGVTVATPIPARVAVAEAAADGRTIWEHTDSALIAVREAYGTLLSGIHAQVF